MSYESPIKLLFPRFDDVISDMAKKQDDMVFDAVARFGVIVDKGELLRALRYDRDQYDKGFADGKAAAMDELVRCKDCMHTREMDEREKRVYCDGCIVCLSPEASVEGYNIVFPDGFCSYGEKRDKEDKSEC